MSTIFENLPKPNSDQRRLFLKAGCPFCTQLAVFLASAGIQSKVKPIFDCPPVRTYVASVNDGKCTFPALEIEEGSIVMLETQDIIQFLCKEHNVNQEELWVFHYFEEGLLQSYRALFGFLLKTKGGYPAAKEWFEENGNIINHPCPPEGAAEVLQWL